MPVWVPFIIRTFRIGRALRLVNTDNQMARDIAKARRCPLKTLLEVECAYCSCFIIFSVIAVQLFVEWPITNHGVSILTSGNSLKLL